MVWRGQDVQKTEMWVVALQETRVSKRNESFTKQQRLLGGA